MARSRDGEGRRGRHRRTCHDVAVYGNGYSDDGDSEGESLCCESDGLEYQKRDPMLDDALFGFFRKQAVKSLKRNFSDFCRDASTRNNAQMNKKDGVGRSVFSRYSLKYFVDVIRKLTPQQRFVIEKFGFGSLLLLDVHDIPSQFVTWVADCVDPVCSQITVGSKPVDISKNTVHVILGLPVDGLEVPCNSEEGRDFILSHFKLSEMPHITFFGNQLRGSKELSEHDVFGCFMTVAISCFLCPNIREYPNCKYLSVLKFPEAASGYDFSKLVHECCLESISQFSMLGKVKGRRLRAPICCNYVPVVKYLDCLDFGRQNVEQTIPRVKVWRGSMIRSFSELDRKRRQHFGKRHLKEALINCRAQGVFPAEGFHRKTQSPIFVPVSINDRENLHNRFVSNLRPDVIDGILNTVDNFVKNKSATKPKIEVLVSSVLDFLSKSRSTPNSLLTNCPRVEASNATKNVYATHMNDVASNLCGNANTVGLVGPRQMSAPLKRQYDEMIQLDTNDNTDPVTPECFITRVLEPLSLRTAPPMNPLKKVKSRGCNLISAEDEAKIFSLQSGSHAKISPVAFINLADSPRPEKQPSKAVSLNRMKQVERSGSKQAPIPIADVSPKTLVDGSVTNIQMVGSTDFRRKSLELAKKVDSTYNHLMSTKHERNGIPEVFEDQIQNVQARVKALIGRKYRFVNFLMSGFSPPLQLNKRFPVSEEDIINYSAIVELAHNSQHKKTLGVKYPEVHCSYVSLGESLMPGGEVDNFLIPCFCRLLFKEKHPSSSGRHYFFPHVGEAILKYDTVPNEFLVRTSFLGAAKASKGRNLGCKGNRLFFPIVTSHHCFVFGVDFEFKLFAFIDSFHEKESDFHQRIKDTLIDNFIHLWEVIISNDHDFGSFKAMYPTVPKQQTLVDCGVFSMKCMEIWKPYLDLRRFFSDTDILNIRIQYANKLYFHSENEADLSLVNDFYT